MSSHLLENTLIRYPPSNNSLLSSGNAKKSIAYEPRTEAISPAINDDILNTEDSDSKSTKDEQTLLVEKLKKVEQEILQTDLQIVRLRKQKDQLEQAANSASKHDDDQENVCDTKQLSIAKLVYHENRAKTLKAYAKLECLGGSTKDLPLYNQPSDNAIYHHNAAKFNNSFKSKLISCFRLRLQNRLKLEESVSSEYDRRMEKWLKSIESEDSQPTKRIKDAKTREFFEKQFPELKKARESGERFSRVGQRVARSDAELDELLDGITEREDQDKKVKSYAVIPPMLEEMRSSKPKFINTNGYVEDIEAQYKEYQILNTWTDEEKDIFRENYLQHPKNFGLIARMTSRKNVPNCVHYYYLSKKSENYKQLVKRQQKRRTRSFVRPAQATPAIPTTLDGNDTQNKTTNGLNNNNNYNNNDKQGGDNATTADPSAGLSSEQSDGSKLGALDDRADIKNSNTDVNMLVNASNRINSSSCCICNCEFNSENNQFRNVTRSNYQLYGIGVETLRPGMRICYPCRFRHVKHPSFDEPADSPEFVEDENMMMEIDDNGQENNNISEREQSDSMQVDAPEVKSDPEPMIENNAPPPPQPPTSDGDNKPNVSAVRPSSPSSRKVGPEPQLISGPSNGEPVKGPQRTCVRDIIYQAIEMSFQKPNIEFNIRQQQPLPPPPPPPIPPPPPPQQQQPPPPPLQPPPPLPPILARHPSQPIQVKQRQQFIEFNIRQQQLHQLQMQQSQQFRHQQFQLPPHQPNQAPLSLPQQQPLPPPPPPPPIPPPPPQQQQHHQHQQQQQQHQQQQPPPPLPPILSRHPSQPIQVPPLPSPMRHGPPPPMQPVPPHAMMPHQLAPQQQQQQHQPPPPPAPVSLPPVPLVVAQKPPLSTAPPPPSSQQQHHHHHQMSSAPSAHHPLNLCRKYNESSFTPDPMRAQAHSKTRPPMAHGAKLGPKMPASQLSRPVAEDLVLNLSAKPSNNSHHPPPVAPVAPVAAVAPQPQPQQQQPPIPPPLQQKQQQLAPVPPPVPLRTPPVELPAPPTLPAPAPVPPPAPPQPAIKSEPEPKPKLVEPVSEPKQEPQPEPEPERKPEPQMEPVSEAKPVQQPPAETPSERHTSPVQSEPQSESQPKPEPEKQPEHSPSPTPNPKPESEAKPEVQSEPNPKPELETEPKPKNEAQGHPQSLPENKPQRDTHTPEQVSRDDESRSPNEMVIDESADAPSP